MGLIAIYPGETADDCYVCAMELIAIYVSNVGDAADEPHASRTCCRRCIQWIHRAVKNDAGNAIASSQSVIKLIQNADIFNMLCSMCLVFAEAV